MEGLEFEALLRLRSLVLQTFRAFQKASDVSNESKNIARQVLKLYLETPGATELEPNEAEIAKIKQLLGIE